ncbi:hypothetical protein EDB89DRAFT_1979147 [Lactarius sanguifluus]|nr:hypothetical protein EDB89DRAFT_1979147 [Lactarius sanguifluus]
MMGGQSHCPTSLPGFCDTGGSHRRATTIDALQDDVLLEILDFSRNNQDSTFPELHQFHLAWKWHLLAHVCRRWRQLIFASPRRLNLRILCTYRTPVRENLAIWPTFPIAVDYNCYSGRIDGPGGKCIDNVIAALEHPNRVCLVGLDVTGSQLETMATVMQEPFPLLTHLYINIATDQRSAPRLQRFHLFGIPFPTLPTLLLSASDLVYLAVGNIPPTGYISPRAIVAALAALPRLKTFAFGFQSATPRPDQIPLPPVTRVVLPSLIDFQIMGAYEYLEELVAQIDSPQLDRVGITYLNQLVEVQVARLSKFLDRSVGPKLALFRHAQLSFYSDFISVRILTMYRHEYYPFPFRRHERPIISCGGIDWRVSNIAQVLSRLSATLSNVTHLLLETESNLYCQVDLEGAENIEWLHLLRQFPALQTLHVTQQLAGHVALALEDITEGMVAEFLPSLDLIYLAGQLPSSLEKFAAACRLADRLVTVIDTETEFSERLESYASD